MDQPDSPAQPDVPAEPDDLLLFVPVANGWSSAVQRAFVAALARCGVVTAATRSVGRSPSSAYRLRKRAGEDSPFAQAWDAAMLRAGGDALDEAMTGGMVERRVEVFIAGGGSAGAPTMTTGSRSRRFARSTSARRGLVQRVTPQRSCSNTQ